MIYDSDPDNIDVNVRNALTSWGPEFLLVYLHFQDLFCKHVKLQSLLVSQLRNLKIFSIKFNVVTEKNYTLSSLSHQTLCTVSSWFRWCFQWTLSYFTLHNSFSLPCVLLRASPWFLLPSCCFCLFVYFFPSDCRKLFTGKKAEGEDASQWLSKISIFPFIEDFSSLPTVLEMIGWDSYCLVSTAQPAVGRRLATGWLCHMPYQLVLDTEEFKSFFASLSHCILPIKYWDKTYITDIQNHLYW